ncbi:SCO2524 family protein [Actinoplanes sp. TFC3]|uniref:SCO2524 family protein n=1 Tax=Actinoplanes sp. TFC3 TaxID=1710355 RepID=UPI0008301366|nr:SCO2524 family protein [Actinoplanes sp. TFC3]
MQIQPRQRILDIWRATIRMSYPDGDWQFGGRDGANSISDAEQLLCIIAPATEIPLFRLDNPDAANRDVLDALSGLGDDIQVPQRLIKAINTYLDTYTDKDGTPRFSGGSYFRAGGVDNGISDEQRRLDVVDSFSISVTLMLAVVGFTRVFRQIVSRPALLGEVDRLEAAASKRLSAAMVGLLRSFTVNVFSADDDFGRELVRLVNQERRPTRMVVDELREALREINARLRDDVTIGSGAAEGSELDLPNRLFECGWSWGIVREAPQIETSDVGTQGPGAAQNAPYLYFTTVACDAIQALSSERTRLLGLLDEAQLKLAQALQLRFELTRSYWAVIATFGGGRWPLEDLPWRTTDGIEFDYFTLLVGGMVMQNMIATRASDADLRRVGSVLEELANRSRITRRSSERESALDVHHPGLRFPLEGSDSAGGPRLSWTVADLSPLLLKRTLTVAGLLNDGTVRSRLLDLSDDMWKHLEGRIIGDGLPEGLWDQPGRTYPQLDVKFTDASWYFTKRVVDCLVTAARIINEDPLSSDLLADIAADLLNEAEHLYDRERLNNSTYSGQSLGEQLNQIGVDLERARTVRRERPGVAVAVTEEVLRKLDRLSAARRAHSGAY